MFDPDSTTLSEGVIAARLLLAVGLGAVIGFEREQLARPAGLRTHMLTALAAALFTIITMEIHAGVLRESRRAEHRPDPRHRGGDGGRRLPRRGRHLPLAGRREGTDDGRGHVAGRRHRRCLRGRLRHPGRDGDDPRRDHSRRRALAGDLCRAGRRAAPPTST